MKIYDVRRTPDGVQYIAIREKNDRNGNARWRLLVICGTEAKEKTVTAYAHELDYYAKKIMEG